MEMKNITFKSLVIFCSVVFFSALLFSMASCAKKKPAEPVVQKPAVSAEGEARKMAEEEARLKAEEERKKADEAARLKAQEEAKRRAEEEARKQVEEKRLKAEEAKKAEEETRAKATAEASAEAGGKESHEVVKGESLWKIAKYKDVYENPFMWPVIYKANHDKINDPDLIYPKQVFSIPRNFSSDDKDKAVHHARTRGEWSLHDGPEKYWEAGYKKK
jgi:nucleoid-associated protein YgaU